MEAGERWAYRARIADPLVEVEVRRIGVKKPPRVLVRFVDEDAEGHQDWVPPARLKAPWSELAEYEAREARWKAVDTHPDLRGAPEDFAIHRVMQALVPRRIATALATRTGVTRIADVTGLAERLRLDEDVLRAEPVSFEEDEALFVPWATTELIVLRACELFPNEIIREVDAIEKEAQTQAVHGKWVTISGRDGYTFFIEPDEVAESDLEAPYGRPMRDLLRRWCGHAAIEGHDELVALRAEIVRIDALFAEAIEALREAGLGKEAASLARRHGGSLKGGWESRR